MCSDNCKAGSTERPAEEAPTRSGSPRQAAVTNLRGLSNVASIATFAVKYRRFLDPDGQLVDDRPPPLARDFDALRSLYALMVRTRTFDAKAITLQRTGKLGTYASCLGHEAIHVGIGNAMHPEDVFAPMYREYGTLFARGTKMEEILTYWGGDERGSDFSGPAHDFPICVPIATQCLHAAGSALAFKLRGEPRVGVSIVGDGGSSKGDFLEALNAAGAWKLPAVFVIANNQYAISVPRSQQSGAETLAQKGLAAGLPCVQVDGNDLLAVHWSMETALQRARTGGGASVIEMMTYRLSDHTTADDARRYRDQTEVDEATAKEPLRRLRAYLEAQGEWDEAREEALTLRCAEEVLEAVNHYLAMEPQPVTAIFDHMYETLPHDLAAQREAALGFEEPASSDVPAEVAKHA